MRVGLRDGAALDKAPGPHPHHELVCLLEGAVTMTGDDGASQTFAAGDTFYITQGAVCGLQSNGPVKALYATLGPDAG